MGAGGRQLRRALGAVVAGLCAVVGAVAMAGGSGAAAPTEGAAVGCGYGSGGPFADNLCWIDMSAFNAGQAGGAGQAMTVTLPGGYEVDFTVRTSGTRPIVPSAFPTWTFGAAEGAPVGNRIYTGTPGQPALYQTTGGGTSSTIELDDILVTDADSNPVSGWRLVGVDAEATDITESITFTSDAAVSVLATYDRQGAATNGCQFTVNQIDANTIQCTGSGVGDTYGTVLVGATAPTSFAQTMTVGNSVSREGVAFAIQTATLSLDTVVDGRVAPSDTFEAAIVSPEGQAVASSDTGTGDAASTGTHIVLPRVDGSAYTLGLAGGGGTDLAGYDLAWSCTRDGTADPSLSATDVETLDVSPDAGEAVACTVRASVGADEPPGEPPTVAPDPVAGSPSFTG